MTLHGCGKNWGLATSGGNGHHAVLEMFSLSVVWRTFHAMPSSEEAPIGIALSAMAIWNPSSSRVETVAVNVPISTRASDRLVIHGNLGWIITPAGTDRDTLFLGVQAEYELTPDLVLMGELFSNDGGAAGGQAGLRWVRDRGRIDFDLLAGHRTDGTSTSSVTLGFTIRR